MFSVRPTESQRRIPITVAIVLTTLALALVLSAMTHQRDTSDLSRRGSAPCSAGGWIHSSE